MSDGWLGFLGGVLATLVGALIASLIQRHSEAKKRKEQTQVDAYFHLIDLKNWYFWVATAELHREEPRPEVLANCRKLSLMLNDKLRAFDDVEKLDEIVTVLFSESIPTANERARRLNALAEQYGKLVSPNYARIINRISNENILRYASGTQPPINAPGSWRYVTTPSWKWRVKGDHPEAHRIPLWPMTEEEAAEWAGHLGCEVEKIEETDYESDGPSRTPGK